MQSSAGPVAILGAGITGLTAAWHLNRRGIPVAVFEASHRPGGVVESAGEHGWLHESGPNSLIGGSPATTALIAGLGLASRRLAAAPAARNRFIVRGGRLVPLPASPPAVLGSRLFSLRAKARLLTEPIRRPAAATADETVADFARRRLGCEFLDYAVDPFVSGIYAGDPERLSIRHAFPRLHALEQKHGSLILGGLARMVARVRAGSKTQVHAEPSAEGLGSFPGGLGEIIDALAAALPPGALRLNAPVAAIARDSGGSWLVEPGRRLTGDSGPPAPERFSAVLSALPADALASLEIRPEPDGPPLGDLAALREIPHPPVASVFLGFRRTAVAHPLDGFGFLVPSVERRPLLGTLFSSTLFPGRAPDGCVALTSFVGGMRRPELAALPAPDLLRLVCAELSGLLGLRADPLFTSIRRWPRAIPQYEVGHGRFDAACASAEARAPGLFIGGNFRGGISVPQCIEAGGRLTEVVAARQGAGSRQ